MIDSEWEYRSGKLIPKEEGIRGRARGYMGPRAAKSREIGHSTIRLESEPIYTGRPGGRRGVSRGRSGGRVRGRLYHPPPHIKSQPMPGTTYFPVV